MPGSIASTPAAASPCKGKIVVIHADEDPLPQKNKLVGFLRGVARNADYDFWWDQDLAKPQFTPEILRQLEEASVVVCILSENFFNSEYIAEVEAPVVRRRIDTGLIVVPVNYWPYNDDNRYAWLGQLNRVPRKVKSIYASKGQLLLFQEVANYVQKCIKEGPSATLAANSLLPATHRTPTYVAPQAISSLRQLPDESFTAAQRKRMRADANKRAAQFVPSAELCRRICAAARALGAGPATPLSKKQLARLDEQFLARAEKRRPDPKKIRWVLRACGLHPQGRARPTPDGRDHDGT